MSELFDTHFHLTDTDDISQILINAEENHVHNLLWACSSPDKIANYLEKLAAFSTIYAAVGVHPHDAEKFENNMDQFRTWSEQEQVKAIGEIGLDYHYDHSPREIQKHVLREFLKLAKERDLPAILHIRDAFEDAYDCLKDELSGSHPFVVHCFTGSPEQAHDLLDIGATISFTGIITFKSAAEIREAMKIVPLDRIMFETDSPYLAPIPFRGRPNQPAYVKHVIEFAAETLELSFEELARISTENAKRFFKIEDENDLA
ncbi:MAG: TatD family hydrolase [Lentisphaeria bacterium]|nr:TatD family hydrolase [Lentisphaeria bacterium]